jgi:phospholipid transport system substrate-binding protein
MMTGMIALVLTLPSPASAGSAMEAIKTSVQDVLDVLTDQELRHPDRAQERWKQLEKVISARFNYDEMARRSLGAHWQSRNDREKEQFVEAFRNFLCSVYFSRVQQYSGEQIEFLSETAEDGYTEVRTRLVSAKHEIPVNYRLVHTSGDWRVYDVVVDGVSLVGNFRGQFNRIIRSSSYEDLIERLRNRPEEFRKLG